jgi:hypothetical protein
VLIKAKSNCYGNEVEESSSGNYRLPPSDNHRLCSTVSYPTLPSLLYTLGAHPIHPPKRSVEILFTYVEVKPQDFEYWSSLHNFLPTRRNETTVSQRRPTSASLSGSVGVMSDSFYLNTTDLATISVCIAALISAPFLKKLSITFTDTIPTIPSSVRHGISGFNMLE